MSRVSYVIEAAFLKTHLYIYIYTAAVPPAARDLCCRGQLQQSLLLLCCCEDIRYACCQYCSGFFFFSLASSAAAICACSVAPRAAAGGSAPPAAVEALLLHLFSPDKYFCGCHAGGVCCWRMRVCLPDPTAAAAARRTRDLCYSFFLFCVRFHRCCCCCCSCGLSRGSAVEKMKRDGTLFPCRNVPSRRCCCCCCVSHAAAQLQASVLLPRRELLSANSAP